MITPFSKDNLKSPDASILTDFQAPSDTLAICFSGTGPGNTLPPFEFSGILRDHPIKKMFVRDAENYAYQGGLKGLTKSIDETADLLAKLVKESKAKRVITLGNCQGGYAAILFGILLGAEKAVTFIPLTFFNRWNRIKYLETRWFKEYRQVYAPAGYKAHYADLLNMPGLRQFPVDVYYDSQHRMDANHSRRLTKAGPHIRLVDFPGGGHLLIRNMKKSGDLDRIIAETFNNK